MLHHDDIWNAIDRLAQINGLSPSGLAKKAGLSATLFNPSKRASKTRKRWPSTESIAAILKATHSTLGQFVALVNPDTTPRRDKLPIIGLSEAAQTRAFEAQTGKPALAVWDEINLPAAQDAGAFALEITGKSCEPVYHEGTRLILSPSEKARRGDRVGVKLVQGEILIKQLGREGALKVELLPLTTESAPITMARKDVMWLYRIVWASQ